MIGIDNITVNCYQYVITCYEWLATVNSDTDSNLHMIAYRNSSRSQRASVSRPILKFIFRTYNNRFMGNYTFDTFINIFFNFVKLHNN